jgi:hypothetical protein
MAPWVADLAALPLILVLGPGPVAVLIALLNWRDRRQDRVLAVAAAQLSSEALRSDVVIHVRARLLRPHAEVHVDMGPCSEEALWQAMVRLRRHLPPHVRLAIEGRVGRELPARFTVELVDRGEARGYSPAAATAGAR